MTEPRTGMFLSGYRSEFERPSEVVVGRLRDMSAATTWAMLNRFTGGRGDEYFLEHVRPLDNMHRCVGPALTISYRPFDASGQQSAASDFFSFDDPVLEQQFRNYHATLNRAWDSLQPGDVIVAEGHGFSDVGQFGDCLLTCFQAKGLAGLVTDATVRDGRHILERDVPVFTGGPPVPGALMHISRDGTSHGLVAVDVNTPIMCDGVCVRPGDLVVADTDGAMVVPTEVVEEVAELGEAQGALENLARELGVEGKPIDDSYMPLVKWIEERGLTEWLEIINKYDNGLYQRIHGDNWRSVHGEG